ncbi:MAG: Wzz/FepE/Etk N-terminal domain-containing protein, partial [Bryobacteraceae bacterium]
MFQVERGYRVEESFNAYEYLGFLRRRAKFILAICLGASALALGVSLLLPNEYTATARVAIDPPPGDPRASVSVSPVYFESLKAYQLLASGDSLFSSAAEKFHLRDRVRPIEALKRKVLKVTLVPETRVLEIAATLRNPGQAQALAQYIAEQSVERSREANLDAGRDLIGQAEKAAAQAEASLQRKQAESRDFS